MNIFSSLKHLAAALIVLLTLAAQARAENYAIDWFTIDGGGGTSTGGVYSVSGTIGQPDAGTLSGGSYQLVGGFWGVVVVVQTPGALLLTATRSGPNVIVSWKPPATGFVLDQTPTLVGSPPPWTQVPFPYMTNVTDLFITVPAPSANKFFRLRAP
jgi:hypothetical protein